ncbi:hypothetical protein MYX82_11865 [Acidobacteria bacterium AH-259-D05]|nr:hypothetical protein [Acidobacteria bacterium AH-259-D05]
MSKKYRQQGYQEDSGDQREKRRSQPKLSREGPRSPRMPGFHQVRRCAMCGVQLPQSFSDIEVSSQCPKCQADLYTCKNCVYFDPASRFECTQPISQRISRKDVKNDCRYFEARTTIEKITTAGSQQPQDARDAFENLFKK